MLKKASEPLYKAPKSIQETIEIMAVAENGIFKWQRIDIQSVIVFRILTTPQQQRMNKLEYLRYCKFPLILWIVTSKLQSTIRIRT